MADKQKDPTEQQILIEEKKTKADGEVTIKKYIKGRFLGKVRPRFLFKFIHSKLKSNDFLGRICKMLRVHHP